MDDFYKNMLSLSNLLSSYQDNKKFISEKKEKKIPETIIILDEEEGQQIKELNEEKQSSSQKKQNKISETIIVLDKQEQLIPQQIEERQQNPEKKQRKPRQKKIQPDEGEQLVSKLPEETQSKSQKKQKKPCQKNNQSNEEEQQASQQNEEKPSPQKKQKKSLLKKNQPDEEQQQIAELNEEKSSPLKKQKKPRQKKNETEEAQQQASEENQEKPSPQKKQRKPSQKNKLIDEEQQVSEKNVEKPTPEKKQRKPYTKKILSDEQQQQIQSQKEEKKLLKKNARKQDLTDLESQKPKKKVKKNEEIEGDFQLEDFQWYRKSKNNKQFLKITSNNQKFDSSLLKNNCFSEMEKQIQLNQMLSLIMKNTQDPQRPTLNEYYLYISQRLKQYLQKRNLNDMQESYRIPNNHNPQIKTIQFLCQNNKESLIIQFKHSEAMAEQLIMLDYKKSYYLNQILGLEKYYESINVNKIVNLMIIPLDNLKHLRFIEFNKNEIIEIQNKTYQLNVYTEKQIQLLKSKIMKQPDMLDQPLTLFINQQLLYPYYESILNNSHKKEYFENLSNAQIIINENCDQQKYPQNKKKLEQYYILHILLKCTNEERMRIKNKYQQYINSQNDKSNIAFDAQKYQCNIQLSLFNSNQLKKNNYNNNNKKNQYNKYSNSQNYKPYYKKNNYYDYNSGDDKGCFRVKKGFGGNYITEYLPYSNISNWYDDYSDDD